MVSVQAKNILIATGSFASKIPIEGAEHAITSDEILNLDVLPEKCILQPQLCHDGLLLSDMQLMLAEYSSSPCNVLKVFDASTQH